MRTQPFPARDPEGAHGFEAFAAGLAILAALDAAGATDAYGLIKRLERATLEAGSPALPFRVSALYAALHELEFIGAVAAYPARRGERPIYGITPRGRGLLAMRSETWRGANRLLRRLSRIAEGERA